MKTTMAAAVHLGIPGLEPVPVEGCGVCEALGRQREDARRKLDLSKVSDCNVEIRNHPHEERA
ncbi:hypothetical protein [Streptomyces sp. IB201691-2A2]|uniref:hypothetical protein n=1 Tax=Streptomyces sp. IB201691-2A2 TaxID=2561920 RepID=UPI00117E4EDF|nr:hypothetical protein [Streptomyces sp. IB201691-2A2]TRO69447.1 hypothetical protein E4K73_01975 [Streptomyces sp. IB201691-2A2]